MSSTRRGVVTARRSSPNMITVRPSSPHPPPSLGVLRRRIRLLRGSFEAQGTRSCGHAGGAGDPAGQGRWRCQPRTAEKVCDRILPDHAGEFTHSMRAAQPCHLAPAYTMPCSALQLNRRLQIFKNGDLSNPTRYEGGHGATEIAAEMVGKKEAMLGKAARDDRDL